MEKTQASTSTNSPSEDAQATTVVSHVLEPSAPRQTSCPSGISSPVASASQSASGTNNSISSPNAARLQLKRRQWASDIVGSDRFAFKTFGVRLASGLALATKTMFSGSAVSAN